MPAPALDRGSSAPDGGGGGEDALNVGGVEVHHHSLWQVELPQLLQKVHPLGFLFDGADQLLLGVLGDDGRHLHGLQSVKL